MLTLSAADIARLLPMADAIEVAADAFRAISRREGLYPARIHMPLEHADALVMPGYDGAAHLGVKSRRSTRRTSPLASQGLAHRTC